ncbi:hypothetical protein KCP73_15370 [Salmonella enterica subsp. enterica]|nr:hypothetical protein KCP73_15370 [Salmonella enterica subsp. enterica]
MLVINFVAVHIDQNVSHSAPVQKILCSDSAYSRVNIQGGMAPITSAPKRTASSNSASPLGSRQNAFLRKATVQVYPHGATSCFTSAWLFSARGRRRIAKRQREVRNVLDAVNHLPFQGLHRALSHLHA